VTKHFAGARIHTLRRTAGLTQVEMAKRLGISTSYLNQLENDQRPLTVTVLMSLSQAFDTPAGFFSTDQDARAIAQLKEVFPGTPEDQLADLVARYPKLIPRMVKDQSPSTSPFEEVRDFYYATNNYFHKLDSTGEELSLALGPMRLRVPRLVARLESDAGVTVDFRGQIDGPRRHYLPPERRLVLRTGLSDAQLAFELSMQYALLVHGESIETMAAPLSTEQARAIARRGLAQSFAAAVTMPYTEFLEHAEATRYDIDLLASRFNTSFESTAHRMSTLQRPGARGVPFFFVRTDRAGNISKRASATAFHFARTGGSCPLWVIHRAFETPNRVTRQIATMPDGRTYLWVARQIAGANKGFSTTRKEFAVGVGCDLDQAHRLVYSDGLDLTAGTGTPIGPGCITCPRDKCPQRAFPFEGGTVTVDVNIGDEEPYRTK
jgi:XRE family transcriptional regulator, fatty acid utilization regulator